MLERLGPYIIEHRIAEGGFGVIYAARDERLQREVAVKMLHTRHTSDANMVSRFRREAQSAAALRHPGIVHIYDIIDADESIAIVMELVVGLPLDQYLEEHPGLRLSDKLEIAAQVAEVLDAAHREGVVHRDVKPANILVEDDGRARLTDFGIAKLLDNPGAARLTAHEGLMGTPAYMAPEQCAGEEATPASDLYALGVVLYEMLTGELPFEGRNSLELLRSRLEREPTPLSAHLPRLRPDVERLVMRLLAKNAQERPRSGAETAARLRRIVADLRTPAEERTVQLERSAKPPDDLARMPTLETPAPVSTEASEVERFDGRQSGDQGLPANDEPHAPDSEGEAEAPPGGTAQGRKWGRFAAAAAVLCAAIVLVFSLWPGGAAAPLANSAVGDYMRAEDSAYGYAVTDETEAFNCRILYVSLVSQRWREGEVEPAVWRHQMEIVLPRNVLTDKAMLILDASGGPTSSSLPPEPLADIAVATGTPVVRLHVLPQEPVSIAGADPGDGALELEVQAVEQALKTGDLSWLLLFPMSKAIARGMDAAAEVVQKQGVAGELEGFVLVSTGQGTGSAAWQAAAEDERVMGVASLGNELMNVRAQLERQVRDFGGFSGQVDAFQERSLLGLVDSPQGEEIMELSDPYLFRNRLDMPKLFVVDLASEDTVADAAKLFYEDLPGETHLLHVRGKAEAARRGLLETMDNAMPPDVQNALTAFYHRTVQDKPLAELEWQLGEDGSYRLVVEREHTEVRLLHAHAPTRDFRPGTEGVAWRSTILAPQEGRKDVYSGTAPLPGQGHGAFYLEVVYPSVLGFNFPLTTLVQVIEADPPDVPEEEDADASA